MLYIPHHSKYSPSPIDTNIQTFSFPCQAVGAPCLAPASPGPLAWQRPARMSVLATATLVSQAVQSKPLIMPF